MKIGYIITMLVLLLSACKGREKKVDEAPRKPSFKVEKEHFGLSPEGDSVHLFTLSNEQGILVKITNYGGIITEIHTPDREGKMNNIVLGFDKLQPYLDGHPYFGALIGRYGNRIAEGVFSLEGEVFTLAKNNGNNSLHGGERGFDKVVWAAQPISSEEKAVLTLNYLSPDGEEGFPGNLRTTVIYELLKDRLSISYEAETDRSTVLNLTNHSYFNLAGEGDILDHVLFIHASRYTPVDAELIPKGELAPVEGTPFDFRKPYPIGGRIDSTGGDPLGYDHNFVLDKEDGLLEIAAKVMDPFSGRTLEVSTTEPGLQFYSGNFLDGSIVSGNLVYNKHAGLCLETQHFPDSPNQPHFPSTILHPGELWVSKTVFRFGTED